MTVALNGSAAVRDRFESSLRKRLAGLITEALVAEHAARPLGPHSDELSRVLTYFRGAPVEGKHVVIAVERDRLWRIGRITRADPSTTPVLLEEGSYSSYEEALHAVFLRRLDDLRAETQTSGS
jgi:branched-chain amino acid transport system permease protein